MGYAADVFRSVGRYTSADRTELREFQQTHFGVGARQCDDRLFDWLYERNPHRPGDGPGLWLARRHGRIVGQQGAIPVALKFGTGEIAASWGIDLMVDPPWRLKGIGPALSAAHEASSACTLGLGVADAARPAYLRRGWTSPGRLRVLVRPLAAAAFHGEGLLRSFGRHTPEALFSGSARLAARLVRSVSGAALESIERFDERSDAIYALASADYEVLVRRDFAALRWRYDETPSARAYERFYLIQRGLPLGYAVLREDEVRGRPIVRVIDYLAPPQVVPALLALAVEHAVRRGMVAVYLEHLNQRCDRRLRNLGFVHFSDSTLLLVRNTDTTASTKLANPDAWFVTLGDSDCDHLPRQRET